MNTPQITQIIRRSNQGATRPFVCRTDDGYVYFVKGRSASTGERIRIAHQTTPGARPARCYLETLSPMKQAFHYNLIRFQPDVETGEFANIGVLVYTPEKHTLAFRLLAPQQHQRITQFFKPLDTSIFQGALALVQTELQRVQKLLPTVTNPSALYEELIRPREDIIRFAPAGVILGEDEDKSADELFRRYIQKELAKAA